MTTAEFRSSLRGGELTLFAANEAAAAALTKGAAKSDVALPLLYCACSVVGSHELIV